MENYRTPYSFLLQHHNSTDNYSYHLANYQSYHRANYQHYNAGLLPGRINPAKVVIYEQASMATQVTPPSDLSSITNALPPLSPDDLCTLQINIASLINTHDAPNNDDDAKIDSIPNLSDAEIDDFLEEV